MTLPSFRSTLGALMLAVLACTPPGTAARVDGPALALTAEVPEARFSVTLCMEGTHEHSYKARAFLYATVTREGGSAPVTVHLGPDPSPRPDTTVAMAKGGAPATSTIILDATGPWEEHAQRRCGAPQTVAFSVEQADDQVQVAIEWNVVFIAEYRELGLCKERIDPTVSIELEPLDPTPNPTP